MRRSAALTIALALGLSAVGCSKTSDTTTGAQAAGASSTVTTAAASSGGGAYGNTPTSSATAASPTTAAKAAGTEAIALKTTDLGSVLVDSKGLTLYMFAKDTGPTSTCEGACATAWPAATVTGTPAVGADLDASKLTTTKRTDGSTQLVYGGHPLYRFAMDMAPGDTKGQGVGGTWYVVGADGNKVDKT